MLPGPYHTLCFKATHNSYQIGPRPWDPAPQLAAGVRGLELDIVQKSAGWDWSVSHGGSYSEGAGNALADYLDAVNSWAEKDTGTDPLHLCLDLKATNGSIESFATKLDAYINSHLTSHDIVSPAELMHPSAPDLVRSIREYGWDLFPADRRVFIVCLSGSQDRKASYAAFQPMKRLCFADIELPRDRTDAGEIVTGNRVALNAPAAAWMHGSSWLAKNPGFLLRVYGVNSEKRWGKACGNGPNILATDRYSAPWAVVGSNAFAPTKCPPNPYA